MNGRVIKKTRKAWFIYHVNYVRRMKDEHRRKERREGPGLQCKVNRGGLGTRITEYGTL